MKDRKPTDVGTTSNKKPRPPDARRREGGGPSSAQPQTAKKVGADSAHEIEVAPLPPETDDDIREDPEFKSFMASSTPEERERLKRQIERDGECRDALVVWKEQRILIDGLTRYDICRELDLPYVIKLLSFASREEVKEWIISNQMARRNLHDEAKSYYRGTEYNWRKQQGKRTGRSSGQSGQKSSTAKEMAQELKSDERTIRRDGKFAEALDRLAESCGDEIRGAVLTRAVRLSQAEVSRLNREEVGRRRQLVSEILANGKWVKPKKASSSGLDRLNATWDKVEVDDRKTFLTDLLKEEGIRKVLRQLGWRQAAAEEEGPTDEDEGLEEREDEDESEESEDEGTGEEGRRYDDDDDEDISE